MEVQISPASLFNGNSQNIIRSQQPQPYEPTSKRFKSDLTFQCIVCSDVYDDPNVLYEHMKKQHKELYESGDDVCSGGGNGFDSDSEHELSDEEYLDLSRLLEPICELRQEDEASDAEPQQFNGQSSNVIAQLMQNHAIGMAMNEEQLRLQLQLQMQLQNHLLQLQMNSKIERSGMHGGDQQKENDRTNGKPLTLRKFKWKYVCQRTFQNE